MKLHEQLFLAGKNVMRSGSKAILCSLAICIGIGSVSLIVSFGNVVENAVDAELRQIGIRGCLFYTKSGEPVRSEALEVFASNESVRSFMPVSITTGGIRLRNQTSSAGIIGVDNHLNEVFELELLHGAFPTRDQITTGASVAVIDSTLAESAYKRTNVVGKRLLLQINGVSTELQICGVIRSQSAGLSSLLGGSIPYFIYLPHTTLSSLSTSLKPDKVIAIIDDAQSQTESQMIQSRLQRLTGDSYRTENLNQYINNFVSISGLLTTFVSGVAAISLIVGGLGVMNAMISSIESRTQEIGIYRALGTKKNDIVVIFLLESLFMCIIGGGSSILLDQIILYAVDSFCNVDLCLQPNSVMLGLTISIACGLLFGWLPAIRAAKLDPIRAIKTSR